MFWGEVALEGILQGGGVRTGAHLLLAPGTEEPEEAADLAPLPVDLAGLEGFWGFLGEPPYRSQLGLKLLLPHQEGWGR